MPRTLLTAAGIGTALALAGCVPPLAMRDAKPGDRVVCEIRPNAFYLVGPNTHTTNCTEAPAPDGPAAESPRTRRLAGENLPADRRLRP